MELKTKVAAGQGSQDIVISRVFELPVHLLFKAYEVPELFEQWMDTTVVKMENKTHGAYRFETRREEQVVFSANGCIHEFVANTRIVRSFQMENTPFPAQLEFMEFEKIDEASSRLSIHIIFKSAEYRNQLLQMPFAQGLNMAHNRLQQLFKNAK